jgi:hypothetical protein
MGRRGVACVSGRKSEAGVCSCDIQVRVTLSMTTAGIRASIDGGLREEWTVSSDRGLSGHGDAGGLTRGLRSDSDEAFWVGSQLPWYVRPGSPRIES